MNIFPIFCSILPVSPGVVSRGWVHSTGLRVGTAAVGVEDDYVLLGRTVVERFKHLFPWRLEILYRGLTVKLAGQRVEEVRVEEGEAGEPVLLRQGVVVHVLPHYHVHHGGADVSVVQS